MSPRPIVSTLLIAVVAVSAAVAAQPVQPREPAQSRVQIPNRTEWSALGTVGDFDSDGVADATDNCVFDPNTDQADGDTDGVGDQCDNCPGVPNPRTPFAVEDFEDGPGGWLHMSRGFADTWHRDVATCALAPLPSTMYVSNGNAGDLCLPDSSRERSQLLGPPTVLPPAGAIALEFDALSFDQAGACTASGQPDSKDVGITLDDGLTYTTLNDCTPLTDGTGVVQRRSFDISAFAGQTIRVIFVYDTVDSLTGDTFAVDNIGFVSNAAGQSDQDADGPGDACDPCTDPDGDGFGTPGAANTMCDEDNCPDIANLPQADGDEDGTGDLCDNCLFEPNPDQLDTDGDEVGDSCDNCVSAFNPREPLFRARFGGTGSGWTHAPRTGNIDTWEIDSDTCFGVSLGSSKYVNDGNAGLACVLDTSQEHSQLLSPMISLPATGFSALEFEVEAFDEAGSCIASGEKDSKDVGVTTDGGATYELLNDCFPLVPLEELGGTVDWAFDLSPWAGQDIQLIWVYDTVDSFNGHTFALDDVFVFSNFVAQQEDDSDADGIGDLCDNCTNVSNPLQVDSDGDAVGDLCDNCLDVLNPLQGDADADTLGDACDPCTDEDADGLGDPTLPASVCPPDNCIEIFNPDQLDVDADLAGDLCDNCIFQPNADQLDVDSDDVGDVCDNCPTDPNDRLPLLNGDFEDGTAPGWTHASRGAADTWHLASEACFMEDLPGFWWVSNGNGGPDCVLSSSHEHSQLLSPPVTLPELGEIELQFETITFDELGACTSNPDDFDKKDVGITIDGGATYTILNNCFPLLPDTDLIVRWRFDLAAWAGQTIQVIWVYDTVDDQVDDTWAITEVFIETNNTPLQELDDDGDNVGGACDNCSLVANPDQSDLDLDGRGDACDNCPTNFNTRQEDDDVDGAGNVCDNCRSFSNPNQNDTDNDGLGNACDTCPNIANPVGVLFDENFEGEVLGWSHAPLAGADTWQVAVSTCQGLDLGSKMFLSNGNRGTTCASDSSIENSYLLGPAIELPVEGTTLLQFDALSYDEAGACIGTPDFDSKDVGVTTDGGMSYVKLNDCFPLADGTGLIVPHQFDLGAWAGQTIQLIWVYDTVDAGTGDTFAIDNVKVFVDQPDSDGDGGGDICDCAPDDASAVLVPFEVATLSSPTQDGLVWSRVFAGNGTVYDVLRGSVGELPVGQGAGESCFASALTTTETTDLDVPPPGPPFFYLVRAVNNCGSGPWGRDSANSPRTSSVCP